MQGTRKQGTSSRPLMVGGSGSMLARNPARISRLETKPMGPRSFVGRSRRRMMMKAMKAKLGHVMCRIGRFQNVYVMCSYPRGGEKSYFCVFDVTLKKYSSRGLVSGREGMLMLSKVFVGTLRRSWRTCSNQASWFQFGDLSRMNVGVFT